MSYPQLEPHGLAHHPAARGRLARRRTDPRHRRRLAAAVERSGLRAVRSPGADQSQGDREHRRQGSRRAVPGFVEEIMPKARVADQALRDRLLALQRRLHARARRGRAAPPLPRRGGHLPRRKRTDPQRVDEAGQPVRQDHGRAEHRVERRDRDDPAGASPLAEPGPRRARKVVAAGHGRVPGPAARSSTSSTWRCSACAARSRRTPGWPTSGPTCGRNWRASTTRRPTASPSTMPSSMRSSRWRGRSMRSRQASWDWHASARGIPTSTRTASRSAVQGRCRAGGRLQPHLRAGGSCSGGVLRRHAGRLPRSALARQQGAAADIARRSR